MKYPLQKEVEHDVKQATDYVIATINNPKAHEVALNYYNAIKRIETICENRKRY